MRTVLIYPQESYHQGHAFLSYQGDDNERVIDVIFSFGFSCIGLAVEVGIENLHLFGSVVHGNILKTLDEGGCNHINWKVMLNFDNHGVKGENIYRHKFFFCCFFVNRDPGGGNTAFYFAVFGLIRSLFSSHSREVDV